jgi:hypothetical protein
MIYSTGLKIGNGEMMDNKDFAKDYNEVFGFNIVPMSIKLDGAKINKTPTLESFTKWFTKKQTHSDLDLINWNGTSNGLAAICGINNLRNLDFDLCDDERLINDFVSHLGLPKYYEWITKTGRGFHIWFYSDYKFDKAKNNFILSDNSYNCDHVEYRHQNCLTVLPPSSYPNSSKYKFLNVTGIIPNNAPYKITKTKLVETFNHFFKNDSENHKKKAQTTKDEFTALWTNEIPQGKRHNTVVRLAGKYKSLGMPENLALTQLLFWNRFNVKPALPEREIEKQLRDIYRRYEPKKEIKLLSAKELQTMELKPTNWIIPDLLPEGLAILAGRPKLGKSFLALNLSLAIAQGGSALGKFQANSYSVFYIPYEDHLRRLQDRIKNILAVDSITESPANLFYPSDCEFPKLNQEGITILEKILDEDENLKFVVVDTLARSIQRSKQRNTNPFQDEYDFGASLQRIAMQRHISILLVHHTTKAKYEDVFDSVLGTTGLTASPDLLMLLFKDGNKYKLSVTGRDILNNDYEMNFNDCVWSVSGESDKRRLTPEREKIIELLSGIDEAHSTGDIAKALGMSISNASNMLKQLVSDGSLSNPEYGKYCIKSK